MAIGKLRKEWGESRVNKQILIKFYSVYRWNLEKVMVNYMKRNKETGLLQIHIKELGWRNGVRVTHVIRFVGKIAICDEKNVPSRCTIQAF